MGQLEFGLDRSTDELTGAEVGQEMADEGSGQTVEQLKFFIGRRVERQEGFFALELTPAGAGRAAVEVAQPAVCQASRGAQVALPQSRYRSKVQL